MGKTTNDLQETAKQSQPFGFQTLKTLPKKLRQRPGIWTVCMATAGTICVCTTLATATVGFRKIQEMMETGVTIPAIEETIFAIAAAIIALLFWDACNGQFMESACKLVPSSLEQGTVRFAISSIGIPCVCLAGLAWAAPSWLSFPPSFQPFTRWWILQVPLTGLCVFILSILPSMAWPAIKKWMAKLPLFLTIALWVAVAAALLTVLVNWWGGWPDSATASSETSAATTTPRTVTGSNSFEAVKVALTAVAGIGGVAYLVIKYKDTQAASRAETREKERIVNAKIQTAIDRLGSNRASTRIAGVYSLADIADEQALQDNHQYKQRVVDILCGYLRSDRKTYPLGEDGKPATDQPNSGDSDKAVESTILDVMYKHLYKLETEQMASDSQLWCGCLFDLHDAILHENLNFLFGVTFKSHTNL